MARVYGVTFAGGQSCWFRAATRLRRESLKSGFFEDFAITTAESVTRMADGRWEEIARFIRTNPKVGYGYWIWKWLIVENFARSANNGSLLLYLDAGCSFNASTDQSRERFRTYMRLASDSLGVAFQMSHLLEKNWTKPSVLSSLSLTESDQESGQLVGGILLLRSSPELAEFASQLLDFACSDNFAFLTDSARSEGDKVFMLERKHRHDQSIFSAMAKRNGQFTILPDETFFSSWEGVAKEFPIWATRNCSSVSALDHPKTYRFFSAFGRRTGV